MYKKLNENNFEKPERGKVVSVIGKYSLQGSNTQFINENEVTMLKLFHPPAQKT
jgi:hypothetical protein